MATRSAVPLFARIISGLLLSLTLVACDDAVRTAALDNDDTPPLLNIDGTLDGNDRRVDPTPTPAPQRGAGAEPGKHLALGRLSGAEVRVSPADQPETIIARGTTDNSGLFSLAYDLDPATYRDDFLLVRVTGGTDLDANGDGIADASGTPNEGELRLLILGRDLVSKSLSITVLSDAAFRAVFPYLTTLPPDAIGYALDEFAYGVLKDDIDGDGFISYPDIVAFNPNRPGERAKLEIRYDDVFTPDSRGGSLISYYHGNRPEDISRRIGELFSGYLLMDLPSPENVAKAFSTVTVRTAGGGGVTSPEQSTLQVSTAQPETRLTFERDQSPLPFTLIAQAEPTFRFSRWVGCPQVNEDRSCTVSPAEQKDLLISAQFLFAQNELNPESGLGKENVLPDAPGAFGVSMLGFESQPVDARSGLAAAKAARTGRIVLSTRLDDTAESAAMRAIIDRIAVDDLVDTGLMSNPLVRVLSIVSPPSAIGTSFYRAVYEVQEIEFFDAYRQFSAEAPDREITLGDLTAVTYQNVDEADQLVTLSMPNALMRPFVPGPNPSGSDEPLGLCPTDQVYEEIFALEPAADGRPLLLCIPENVPPLAANETCGPGQAPIEVLDGRRYCVASGAPEEARAARVAKLNGYAGPVIGASPPQGKFAPLKPEAREVFLTGYGRAFELGNNLFLTQAPNEGGLAIVEVREALPIFDRAEALRLKALTCEWNTRAEGCEDYPRGRAPLLSATNVVGKNGFNVFPEGFGFDLGSDNLKAEIALQLNVNARATGNFKFSFEGFLGLNPTVRANTSGFVRITPSVGVKLIAELGETWGADGRPSGGDNPSATLDRSLWSFDYAMKAGGAAAIFTGELRSSIGVEVKGAAELETNVRLPIIVSWDGNAEASLFGDKKIDFSVVPELQATLVLTGQANLTVEPYLEFALINGLRAVAPELTKVSLRGFVQGEMILSGPTLSITNEPEQLAIQENKTVCLDGQGGLAFNAYYGLRSEFEVTTRDQEIHKVIEYTRNYELGEWKWRFASYGWDFDFGKLALPASPSNGFSVVNVADEPEPCTGGLRPENDEYIARPGELQLRDNAFVGTATRQLVMQQDGNLVLYDYDGEAGEQGEPIWATGTNGTFNVRMVYQRDGNLVLYNLRNQPIWASGTQRYSNSELRLTADDELQIFDRERNFPVWSYELTQKAGEFTLRSGDYIVTPNRTLYMQRDGNLVLYRFNPGSNSDNPAFWATGTSGHPGSIAVFQEDGNLVVYRDESQQRALWASNTSGRARDGTLELTRDGNLEIRSADGERVFSTNTANR